MGKQEEMVGGKEGEKERTSRPFHPFMHFLIARIASVARGFENLDKKTDILFEGLSACL